MNIGIDASVLGNVPVAGIGNYIRNLITALAGIDNSNKYNIYGLRINDALPAIKNSNFNVRRIPDLIKAKSVWYSWTLWNYTLFPFQLAGDKLDIFISSIPALPLYCPSPRIFIVYDLVPYMMPEAFLLRARLKFKLDIFLASRYAERVFAISISTKNDMVKYLHADPAKISVIYPGYDEALFRPVDDEAVLKIICNKYDIDGSYILYVGTLEPRKNIARLIEAFVSMKKSSAIKHKLVIAGTKGWLYDNVFKSARESGMQDDIVFTGYVEGGDLPALYSGADVFIYPSLYEGFGLPPLEAMACGTPVITSNNSSLPEVVGDAGILIDPYDIDGMAEAIYRVISDHELQKDMRRRGVQRARLFSWEKAAREMLQIIESTVRIKA